ncbi:MAG: hypothetical protein P4M01_05740 [Acidobacteriota bacterium]|nr:hypothetical protein [Acidobacteriota bacterium]
MLLKHEAQQALLRMFRDPYTLEDCERKALVRHLEDAVKTYPQVPEIRVLLGMALCVDLNAQPALEHLREAVRMAPDNFMARLKLGELLMRLRICGQAEEQTRAAAKIAINSVQAELARRQAAALRTMQRNGIERGGYAGVLDKILPLLRNLKTRRTPETAITLDIN